MAMETQDIIKRSATNSITPPSQVRDYKAEVAKLIDVSTCIGCKACQVACSEWNDIRDEVGHCVGVYDNPADLSAKSWTVMRFSETEQNGKLEWLIRKDGCMHLSLIHISEPTRLGMISYAVFCLKKKKKQPTLTSLTVTMMLREADDKQMRSPQV